MKLTVNTYVVFGRTAPLNTKHFTIMTKRIFSFAALLFMALTVVSCLDYECGNPVAPDKDAAEYTILYYANGGSNVDQCILPTVEDFYKASPAAFQRVNVVIQYKFSTADNLKKQFANEDHMPYADRFDDSYAEHFGARTVRWVVNPAKTMDEQMNDPANLYGEENADCTCPDSLTNFINWAVAAYPAKKYILVVNDHGHGYIPNEDLPDVTRGILFDDGHLLADGTRKHCSVKSFTRSIRSAKVRFETIYMLACLMNNFEYLYEMKDLCDYIIASTYVMPAVGGALNVLADQFSQPAVDVEKALSTYCQADVESWSEGWGVGEDDPVYFDLTVTRTEALDQLGHILREFTDRLCLAYKYGTDAQRQLIDDCTAKAVKINMDYPFYDGAKYIASIMRALPEVYDEFFYQKLKDQFNNAIVSQYYSKYLERHNYQVDYSILLGVEGSYSVLTWQSNEEDNTYTLLSRKRYMADGTTYVSNYTPGDGERNYLEADAQPSDPWGSTLACTFEQLKFDRIVGWSRWLKLNKTEPSLFCPSGQDFVLPDGDVSGNPNLN